MAELGGRQPYPIRVQSLHAARKVDWIEIIPRAAQSVRQLILCSTAPTLRWMDWIGIQAKPSQIIINTVQHSTVRLPAATRQARAATWQNWEDGSHIPSEFRVCTRQGRWIGLKYYCAAQSVRQSILCSTAQTLRWMDWIGIQAKPNQIIILCSTVPCKPSQAK